MNNRMLLASLLVAAVFLLGWAAVMAQTPAADAASAAPAALAADFVASPVIGRPPLSVAFGNTSTGGYTSSLWDFGDGATSTLTHPTHIYTAAGAYTVTLTVGDGVATATASRPRFIHAVYWTYLPLASQDYNPLLYDDFDDTTYDGSYDPALWSFSGAEDVFQAQQQAGVMLFTNGPGISASGADLVTRQPPLRTWQQVQYFEGKLKVSSDRAGDWSSVQLYISSSDIAGRGWFTQCYVGGRPIDTRGRFGCEVAAQEGSQFPREYEKSTFINFDTWYRVRIEADPATGALRFFLNDALFGAHTPADAAALVTARNLRASVGVWNNAANAFSTRYADDILLTPVPPAE
jgi:hypothetical protein